MVNSTAPRLDRNGLHVLNPAECLRLLASSEVGRVGTTAGALPVVLPVRYRLVGDDIVFRTRSGTLLDAGAQGTVVAFEVDHFDVPANCGWSVVVTGVARRMNRLEVPGVEQLPGWAAKGEDCVVVISTEMVSGRRMTGC